MIRDERLPSMPIAIQRLLALAERRNGDATELCAAVSTDPALVLALLRAARDGQPHATRIAIDQLGFMAALRVCLEFRVVDRRAVRGFDGLRHWRRGVLAAAYARALAQCLRRSDVDLIQTAAVLCHVSGLPGGAPRRETLADWLAAQGVCGQLCALVAASRDAQSGHAAACVALAECMAEVWLEPGWEAHLALARTLAGHLFGPVPDLCSWVFGVLGPQAGDLEMLLQMRWPDRRRNADWRARAQRLLRSGPPHAQDGSTDGNAPAG